MNDKRIKKVMDIYNDNFKSIRAKYIFGNHYEPFYKYVLDIAPIILTVFIILVFHISLGLIIFLTILMIVLHVIIFFFKKDSNYRVMIDYYLLLKNKGFKSISSFEEFLKDDMLGKGKYCEQLLNYYIEEYNIDDTTFVVSDLDKNKYYIWCDDEYLYLLPCVVKDIIFLKKIRLNDVYYFRKTKFNTVLKTRIDVLTFDVFANDVFMKIITEKKYENIMNFEPDKYINDFELYMHMARNDLSKDSYLKGNNFSKIFILYLLFVGIFFCNMFFHIPSTSIMKLIMIVIVIIINYLAGQITDYSGDSKNDDLVLNEIISLPKTQEMFRELKVALNIFDDYDKAYTPTGACYLCWVKNSYFHVFLNQIYYNCVYMVISVKDIDCYYVNKDELVIQTKMRNLSFNSESKRVFDRILPNKDREWVKGLKK